MDIIAPKRKFLFNDVELADPDPTMPLKSVLSFHSSKHPELVTADVKQMQIDKDGTLVYAIKTELKTKG